MIKKYGSKIFTSVSFTGIAISNIKAAKVDITVLLNGDKYFLNKDECKVDQDQIISFDGLIRELDKLGVLLKKDGSLSGKQLNLTGIGDKYFVKSVKVGANEKLTDVTKFTLTGETINDSNKLTVELVLKEDCIEFEYTGAKQLKKGFEQILLKTVIQGKKVEDIKDVGALGGNFGVSTLNNKVIKGKTDIIGKDVKVLDENNKIKFKIDSTKIAKYFFKTVVCKFADGVEKLLVKGINLEKLCVNPINNNAKLSDVRNALNTKYVDGANNNFFKNDASLEIHPDGNNGKTLSESVKTEAGCKILVIENIKEADINPIFLKKTFSVEFDKTGAEDKNVNTDILDKITDALNKELTNKVDISVKNIIDEIVKVKADEVTLIIKESLSSNLSQISFDGVKSDGNLKNEDKVDKKIIKVKLKAGAFNDKLVGKEISLKFKTDDINKGKRKLKSDIKDVINTEVGRIKTQISKIQFANKFNSIIKLQKVDSETFDISDFNFGSTVTPGNDAITNDGVISFKDSGINKIADSCFDDEPKPKPKTDDSNGSSSSDGSGEQKESKNKCCCKKNNN